MDCVTVTTQLVTCEKRYFNNNKNDYKLDLWEELKKRWMILGVLTSMLLAVLSPRFGAPGGPLKTEYLSYLPLCCVYFSAGRRATAPRQAARWGAISAAHAHIVAPALAAVTAGVLADAGVDSRLIMGALVSCVGAPCAWLSLSACSDAGAALAALAGSYVASLVAAPAAMFVICGRVPIPALGPSLWSALCTLPPLTAGAIHSRFRRSHDSVKDVTTAFQSGDEGETKARELQCPRTIERVSALALLYVDCCERLREAEGSLYVGDVLTTLVIAVWSVGARALCCRVLAPRGARTLALCAVPKALHMGWESSTECAPAGLARLPAVFAAPAQALLAAALADYPHNNGDEDHDALPQ